MEIDKNIKELNLWEKLNKIRFELSEPGLLIKTGSNKHLKFDYFELSDVTPKIIEFCEKYNLSFAINFETDKANLKLKNSDKIEETEKFEIPIITNATKMQEIGAIITYATRYLYQITFLITENDILNQNLGDKNTSNNKKNNQNLNSDDKVDKSITREKKLIEIGEYLNKNDKLEKALEHFKVTTLNKLKDEDLDWIIASYKIKF
jgi:hypothetical protein